MPGDSRRSSPPRSGGDGPRTSRPSAPGQRPRRRGPEGAPQPGKRRKSASAEAREALAGMYDVEVTCGLIHARFRVPRSLYVSKFLISFMAGGETLILKASYGGKERNIVLPGGVPADILICAPNPAEQLPVMEVYTAEELQVQILEKMSKSSKA